MRKLVAWMKIERAVFLELLCVLSDQLEVTSEWKQGSKRAQEWSLRDSDAPLLKIETAQRKGLAVQRHFLSFTLGVEA